MKKKRLFDLALTLLSAVLWVPAVCIAGLCVLVSSGRPVFYTSHRRVSHHDVGPVTKFRTMVKNADKLVNRDTVPVAKVRFLNIPSDSPLYTPVGRQLERFGLTEVPQFLHVLSGRMSIIGNRPLPENVMACLRDEYSFADDRFLTPAGVTGLAQLVGREALSDDERLRLESAYCRACAGGYSMRLDFTILLYTVLIVLHLRKPMSYQAVLDMVQRQSKGAWRPAHHPSEAGGESSAAAGFATD